ANPRNPVTPASGTTTVPVNSVVEEISWRTSRADTPPSVTRAVAADTPSTNSEISLVAATTRRTLFQSPGGDGPDLQVKAQNQGNDKEERAPPPRPLPSTSMATELPPSAAPMMGGGIGGPQQAPGELNRVLLPPYVIGPPDVLLIESLKGLLN